MLHSSPLQFLCSCPQVLMQRGGGRQLGKLCPPPVLPGRTNPLRSAASSRVPHPWELKCWTKQPQLDASHDGIKLPVRVCLRINSFPWRNPQGQPHRVICPAAFRRLSGKSCYALSAPGLIPREPIWEQMEGPDPLTTAAPAQPGWGATEAAARAGAPLLVANVSPGGHNLGTAITPLCWLWPAGPLGAEQRLEEPRGGSLGGGSGWLSRG